MTTTKILTLTLLATTLAFSAALPRELTATTKQQTNSISNQIANILYKRGIEEDKAQELSHAMINTNEELFAIMINNFVNTSGINKDDVLNELSKLALNKKNVDLTSYAFLVKLMHSLKNSTLNEVELKKIAEVSTKNSMIFKVFA